MNSLLEEDLKIVPCCQSCDSEFDTQEYIDELEYVRTTASCDIYKCPDCLSDCVFISSL